MLTFPTISYDWGETIFTLYIVKLFQKYVFFFFLWRVNLQNTSGRTSEKRDEQHNRIKKEIPQNNDTFVRFCEYTQIPMSLTWPSLKEYFIFFKLKVQFLVPCYYDNQVGVQNESADVTNRGQDFYIVLITSIVIEIWLIFMVSFFELDWRTENLKKLQWPALLLNVVTLCLRFLLPFTFRRDSSASYTHRWSEAFPKVSSSALKVQN